MTISGVLFLFAFLVVGFVLVKFTIKAATALLSVVFVLAAVCWFHPPMYEAVKPKLLELAPFLQSGAEEALSTAKSMANTAHTKKENVNE